MSESSKLNEITDPNGADAPEPLMKIVLYVQKSKLPDDLRKIISDPIDKDEYGKILEALSKVSFEDGTETRKSLFIKPSGYPHKIRIRRKDAVWVDRKKGKLSRSTLLHRVIEAYKKSAEIQAIREFMNCGLYPGDIHQDHFCIKCANLGNGCEVLCRPNKCDFKPAAQEILKKRNGFFSHIETLSTTVNVVGCSFYDTKGKLYVDCTECARYEKQTCSAASHAKKLKPGLLGCFLGELIPGITPGDLRASAKSSGRGCSQTCQKEVV